VSELRVTPEQIVEATRPMQPISAALGASHAQIGAHADAGAGTSGACTVEATFAAWSSALPRFAAAADRLIMSMTLSAAGYQSTDAAIGDDAAAAGAGG